MAADGEDQPGGVICPIPHAQPEFVQMAHGGGGRAMAQLIDGVFAKAFANPLLDTKHDGAVFDPQGPIAFTTDSYVVQPLIFPGGDIGTLAVNGTVNDLAMCGARPLHLSVGFIMEDGLPMDLVRQIVQSMAEAATAAGVTIVTGDTKVVEKGKADGLFITSTGVGRLETPHAIAPKSIQPGDMVIVSGDLARHGIAVIAARESIGFDSEIQSDCASLSAPILDLLNAEIPVHCLRDLTRGGLASALVEITEAVNLGIELDEAAVPIRDDVRAACELLGFDPIHVANEGRFVAFVPQADADQALQILKRHDVSHGAVVAGQVTSATPGQVILRGQIGGSRVVDMLSGEQLPRIC